MVGVAVKVTPVPGQMVCAVEAMDTDAGALGFTVIVPVAFAVPQPPVSGML